MQMKFRPSFLLLLILLGALPGAVHAGAAAMSSRPHDRGDALAQEAPPLTASQRQSLEKIFTANKVATAGAGLLVAGTAKKIYDNLLAEHPNRKLDQRLSAELHTRAGKILSLHGLAMRQSLAVLTPAQIGYLRAQRGKTDTPIDLLEQIGKTYGIGEK
jgi:hypothetical protein